MCLEAHGDSLTVSAAELYNQEPKVSLTEWKPPSDGPLRREAAG